MSASGSLVGRDLLSVADLSTAEVGAGVRDGDAAEGGVPRASAAPGAAAGRADAGDAVPEAEPADAGHVRCRHDPAGRQRDLPDQRHGAGRPRERPGRRTQPGAVRRRHRRADRAARGRRRARLAGEHPGHQRPDPARASRARPWPTSSRSGSISAAGWRARPSRSSATATTSTTRWRCSGRPWGWRSGWRIPAGYAPNERIVARAEELAEALRRPARVRVGSRPRSSVAPTSSTPTPGPRWARRPRPRNAATRSPATR